MGGKEAEIGNGGKRKNRARMEESVGEEITAARMSDESEERMGKRAVLLWQDSG